MADVKGMQHDVDTDNTVPFLALYTGPCGPISVEIWAENLDEAREIVRSEGGTWFDDAHDELNLPPDAPSGLVDEALELNGWRQSASCEFDGWQIHRRDG